MVILIKQGTKQRRLIIKLIQFLKHCPYRRIPSLHTKTLIRTLLQLINARVKKLLSKLHPSLITSSVSNNNNDAMVLSEE